MSSISVLITAYNEAPYIADAIESVLEQTVRPMEVLVLDDASTDGTADIIREYAEEYPDLIVPHIHEENLGVARNRNYGVEIASGDKVTFLDGDNRFHPRKLAAECAILNEGNEVGLAFSDFYYTDEDGGVIGQWCSQSEPPTGDVYEEVLTRDWPSGTLFSHPMVERSVFDRVGPYDEKLGLFEDWEMFVRLTEVTEVGYTGEPLVEYRQHPGSLSNEMSAAEAFEAYKYILGKHAPNTENDALVDRMHALLEYQRAEMHYEGDERLSALGALISAIRTDPSLFSKADLKFILPKRAFHRLQDSYRAWKAQDARGREE